MNLNKSRDYFDPDKLGDRTIHIIGCGAVGSTLAETLTRMGIKNLTLWDDDIVSAHNIANQSFFHNDIGAPKVEQVAKQIKEINPEATPTLRKEKYKQQPLSGYVCLCVDNIDTRRAIVEQHINNPYIKLMMDFRMRLTDAQHYAADWSIKEDRENLLSTMQFSHEEAQSQTPVSACGTTLNVVTTVKVIVSLGVANLVRFVLHGKVHKMILMNLDDIAVDAM